MNIPIILAHGIFRIDEVRVRLRFDDLPHYFLGIAPFLRQHGLTVTETNVDFAGSLEKRAQNLADEVDRVLRETGADKVAILGHSMGGLDARKMIVDLGFAPKVSTLITIGTPHHGSPAADLLVSAGGGHAIDALRPFLDLEGFRDLVVAKCNAFNERAERAEADNDVVYRVVTASSTLAGTVAFLAPTHALLDGPNDGIVPVSSQRWTEELRGTGSRRKRVDAIPFPIHADHLNEIGWWHPVLFGERRAEFEQHVKSFYLQLAQRCIA